jgi:small subunit ribosomal protein S18
MVTNTQKTKIKKKFEQKKKQIFRRKRCKFCVEKIDIDYKDQNLLRGYISERGKILSARVTGTCRKHQHKLAQAIKRARILALLPFTTI